MIELLENGPTFPAAPEGSDVFNGESQFVDSKL